MAVNICIYEDTHFDQFYPLTYFRPVFLLRPGILPLFEQTKFVFRDCAISFSCRTQISSLTGDEARDIPVNIIKKGQGDILFLNGRIKDFADLPQLIKGCRLTTIFKNGQDIIGVLFKDEALVKVPDLTTPEIFGEILPTQKSVSAEYDTKATLYNHLWELVDEIPSAIAADFGRLNAEQTSRNKIKVHEGAHFINEDDIHLSDEVEIFPTAVLDASSGPIYVGPFTTIRPQATIVGPCYIANNCTLYRGLISGSSIGPNCRVGGEVEASIFQSYVNKYHDGFIGHSYVGSWVNFGAMTTNSDLKNNYSNIRVSQNGQEIDTGSIKVGSFIGDFCRFGIGTMLNTGINVGVSSNIFGGSLITDKEIKPFSWGSSGSYERYDIDKAIDTAETVCSRRDCLLPTQSSELLRAIFNGESLSKGALDF